MALPGRLFLFCFLFTVSKSFGGDINVYASPPKIDTHGTLDLKKSPDGSSYSYSYSYSMSYSYSYSYSAYSSPTSNAYYYTYGYSASGYQAEYRGGEYDSMNFQPQGRPRANSWVEQICDLLPYRSVYVGNRCFFSISSEYLAGKDKDLYVRSIFSDDFMHDVNVDFRLANVDRDAIYNEFVRGQLLVPGVSYTVLKYFKGGNVLKLDGSHGSGSGYIYEFSETHTCREGSIRFGGYCYKYNQIPKSFNDALDACERIGANLPVIENDDQNRFVASLVQGQSTWIATFWPRGADKWEISQPFDGFLNPLMIKKQDPKYYRWLSYSNTTTGRNSVLFGTKDNFNFWYGYWANMDGHSSKQPYVCVTDIVIGSYPDIVEPYPSGPEVSVIISNPNTTRVNPDKCCTAQPPILITDEPGKKYETGDVGLTAITPPGIPGDGSTSKKSNDSIVVPVPTTTEPPVNVEDCLSPLYRFICKAGSCYSHHTYGTVKATYDCCDNQGYISKVIERKCMAKLYRQCPNMLALVSYFNEEKGGHMTIAAKVEDVKKYMLDSAYKQKEFIGYCAEQQGYCGATMPIYEVKLATGFKNDFIYSVDDDEISWIVAPNDIYKGNVGNDVVCYGWHRSNISQGPQNETVPNCIKTGVEVTIKPGGQPSWNATITPNKGYEVTEEVPSIVNPPGVPATKPPPGAPPPSGTSYRPGPPGTAPPGQPATPKSEYTKPPPPTEKACSKCKPGSCGPNTQCYVRNCIIQCVCKVPYTGNPYGPRGCNLRTVSARGQGDPHYSTFDGMIFDFQGTCPYVYSMNCKPGNIAPYKDYKVKAKNTNSWNKATLSVSRVVEVEVEFDPNVVIHIDANYRLYVNNEVTEFDYYWPSAADRQISVIKEGSVFTIARSDGIRVYFKHNFLEIHIPDVPQLRGTGKLCGLAGDRDNKCANDLRTAQGQILQQTRCHIGSTTDAIKFAESWVTKDFFKTPGQSACQSANAVLHSSKHCGWGEYSQFRKTACSPIAEAAQGQGAFAACRALGGGVIENFLSGCAFDVCMRPEQRCPALAAFAQKCLTTLKTVQLPNWRAQTRCKPGQARYRCPLSSEYSTCASKCQPTCQKCRVENGKRICWGTPAQAQKCTFQSQKICNGKNCRWQKQRVCAPVKHNSCVDKCTEGCMCNTGFVVDRSSGAMRCVRANQCPGGSFLPVAKAGAKKAKKHAKGKTKAKVVIKPQARGNAAKRIAKAKAKAQQRAHNRGAQKAKGKHQAKGPGVGKVAGKNRGGVGKQKAKKQKAQGPRPKAQGPRPKAQGPRPKAQGPRPKAQGPRPKAQGKGKQQAKGAAKKGQQQRAGAKNGAKKQQAGRQGKAKAKGKGK